MIKRYKVNMPKRCNHCKYFGRTTHTCDYMLITHECRGCTYDKCDKFDKGVTKRVETVIVTKGGASNLPPDMRDKARELYDKGMLDTEIAYELKVGVSYVVGWRTKNALDSNADRMLDGEI